MSGHPKHLPADERRAATVEAVVDLAAEQNPSDITTAAIAQGMGLTQGGAVPPLPEQGCHLGGGHVLGGRALARPRG